MSKPESYLIPLLSHKEMGSALKNMITSHEMFYIDFSTIPPGGNPSIAFECLPEDSYKRVPVPSEMFTLSKLTEVKNGDKQFKGFFSYYRAPIRISTVSKGIKAVVHSLLLSPYY